VNISESKDWNCAEMNGMSMGMNSMPPMSMSNMPPMNSMPPMNNMHPNGPPPPGGPPGPDPFYTSPFSPFYRRPGPGFMGQQQPPDYRIHELNKRLQQRNEVRVDCRFSRLENSQRII
jgi:hypothetical protein